ncbi:ubiquitin-like protein [Favolaschia claudopus]|uniref:Ubiquitin-like protein n=1 Tax=Favolaschia claudopus TaxID=2862362 RepID=A0AAW0CLD7_9AGAR
MAEQAEVAFLRVYLNTLSSQPLTYNDNYQQPPQNSLKKVPVLQISLPPPPVRAAAAAAADTASTLTLTFKSLKPAASFSLSAIHPADSILSLKQRIAAEPNGPPVSAQRLLFKGKALADAKLVKEYPNLLSGETVNLVLKPTTTTDAAPAMDNNNSNTLPAPKPTLSIGDRPVVSAAEAAAHPRRHTRIPSVVLSPSPSHDNAAGSPAASVTDITLTLDNIDAEPGLAAAELSTYHEKLAEPEFWEALLVFLNSSFPAPADAARAWEDFLRASKNTLTASEVARIRDRCGVSGMAGT